MCKMAAFLIRERHHHLSIADKRFSIKLKGYCKLTGLYVNKELNLLIKNNASNQIR
jgi:hypothetical protein